MYEKCCKGFSNYVVVPGSKKNGVECQNIKYFRSIAQHKTPLLRKKLLEPKAKIAYCIYITSHTQIVLFF